MENKHIFIFRHGETQVSKYGGMYWSPSAKLLAEATKPLERLGNYLQDSPPGKYFMSPLFRCQQTVAIVTKKNKRNFVVDTRLQEYGMEFPWTFIKRVKEFIKDLENLPDEHIYICTHGIVITALINLLTDQNLSLIDLIKSAITPIKPAVLVIISDNKIQTISFRKDINEEK